MGPLLDIVQDRVIQYRFIGRLLGSPHEVDDRSSQTPK